MAKIKGMNVAKNIIDGWIEANKERIESCIRGENYGEATKLDSYNAGLQQAMILIEQALTIDDKDKQ